MKDINPGSLWYCKNNREFFVVTDIKYHILNGNKIFGYSSAYGFSSAREWHLLSPTFEKLGDVAHE